LGTNNVFQIQGINAGNMKLSINTNNGALNGSFVHPITGVTNSIRGAVLQQQNSAAGFFFDATHTGSVVLFERNQVGD
jgi:hypothetical protein